MLFGCYRRGDANDADGYVAAIGAVLTLYDPELVCEVTDPRTGIQTTEKYMTFMPQSGELKVYCEALAARRDRIAKLGPPIDFSRPRLEAPPRCPSDLATVFVPDGHRRYAYLVAWAALPDTDPRHWRYGRSSDNRAGIWVAWYKWDAAIDDSGVRIRLDAWKPAADLTLSATARADMAKRDEERSTR
jgi:hypothetical protein